MSVAKIDWSLWTPRCSSLGHIMTGGSGKSNLERYNTALDKAAAKQNKLDTCGPRTQESTKIKLEKEIDKHIALAKKLEKIKDVPNLSETCKVHLSDVFTRIVYGRTEDIKSKYLEKGLLMEEEAITQYSLLTGEFHKKNKIRQRNEWLEGEMDFDDEEYVNDAKVNWSVFQFNRVASRPIKPLYAWQLEGYCWLFDKPKGRLIYSLINTPEHLIKREESRLMYDLFGNKEQYDFASPEEKQNYKEACVELRRNHIYYGPDCAEGDEVPINKRVRTFEIVASEEKREQIKTQVKYCREYLAKLDDYGYIDSVTDIAEEEEETEYEAA